MSLNSASMMWEMIEAVFEGIRGVMRANGRVRSGSFWEVTAATILGGYSYMYYVLQPY
jgi:hypothetical protein